MRRTMVSRDGVAGRKYNSIPTSHIVRASKMQSVRLDLLDNECGEKQGNFQSVEL